MTDQYQPFYEIGGSNPEDTPDLNTLYPASPTAPTFGTPPADTSAFTQAMTQPMSVLQELLTAAGLQVPAASPSYYPAPSFAPTKDFLRGISPDERAYAAANGTTITDVQGDDRVYMGKDDFTGPTHIGTLQGGEELAGTGPTTKHKSTTFAAAMNMPYLWDQKKVDETMKKMRSAGFNVDTFDQLMGVWNSMVSRASKTFVLSKGETLVTPWDMLAAAKKENINAGVIDKDGNIVHKATSTSVTELSQGDAWSTLRSTMQDMLGRDPTDQEVRDFLSAANADAAADPSTSTRTTTTNSVTGQSTSNTVNHQGYTGADAQRSAYDDLHDSADYASYQSAGTYFNAMLAGLGEVAGSQ